MQFGFLTPTWVSRLQEVQRAIRLMIESAIREYLIEGKHIERSCTKEINDSSMKGRMQNWKKKKHYERARIETLIDRTNCNSSKMHKGNGRRKQSKNAWFYTVQKMRIITVQN